MKRRIAAIAVVMMICSCSAGPPRALSTTEYFSRYSDLASALSVYPSLAISGVGGQKKIVVRRNASVVQKEPLYVLDGLPIGNNYQRANLAVDMPNVKALRVLVDPVQTLKYGSNGSAGVIVIITK